MIYVFNVRSNGAKLFWLPIVGAFYDADYNLLIGATPYGRNFWPIDGNGRKFSGKLRPSNFPSRVAARRAFDAKQRDLLSDPNLTVSERMTALYGVTK